MFIFILRYIFVDITCAASVVACEIEIGGVVPNFFTYAHLISGLVSAGKARAALTLFESASLDPVTIRSTENARSRRGRTACPSSSNEWWRHAPDAHAGHADAPEALSRRLEETR